MEDFKFKKKYGQNFLSDENLLKAIVLDSGISSCDTVLEIGPGKGALTKQLSLCAKKVVAVEIDDSLKEYLNLNLESCDNVEVLFKDIMKMTNEEIEQKVGCNFKIVANLPYYITTPILFKFLESNLNVQSITVMVQKEVAERMCAESGDEGYGVLSIMCNYYANPKIKRIVNRKMFYPVPNVDSAIVRLDINPNVDFVFAQKLHRVVQGCFSMRRKTLVNNLMKSFGWERVKCEDVIKTLGYLVMVRPEELSVDAYVALANKC